MNTLIDIDHAVFTWINTTLGNPVFDYIMPLFREKLFWAPLYLFIVAFALLNFGRKGAYLVLGMVAVVALADTTSSRLIKKNVERLRPCNEPVYQESVQLRVEGCGSGYSFTSSHACNHFAVAVFLSGLLGGLARWVRPALLTWAALIAFAQVYVGVHFPGDVIVGALIGSAIGWWMAETFFRWGWFPRISLLNKQ